MVLVHTQALSGGDEQAHCTCHFRTTKQMFPSGAVRSLISSAPGKASGCWLSPPMAELQSSESELTATRALSLTGCSFPACETGCHHRPHHVPGGAGWWHAVAPEPGHSVVKPSGLPRVPSSPSK